MGWRKATVHLTFPGLGAEKLLMGLPEIAVSSGAACSSDSVKSSHVLRGIGLREDAALGSVRFGIGRFNTQEEIEYAIERVPQVVRQLRGEAPKTARC